jgi:HEAT repeat protein
LQLLMTIGAEESAPALGKALETAEPDDRAALVRALVKMGPGGVREAVRIYGDGSQTAEARMDAATVLAARSDDAAAGAALVAGAGRGEPGVRTATMRGLAALYLRAPERVEAALATGGGGGASRDDDERRVGDLARALGLARRVRPEGVAALASAWSRGGGFALRLRLVRAMGEIGDPRFAPSLAQAAGDAEPVLRAAAVGAAGALGGAGEPIVRQGLGDRDPGVRHAALATAGHLGDVGARAAEALGHDGWPMVRRAAAERLGAVCRSDGAARTALGRALGGEGKNMSGADPAEDVRRAALGALGHCGAVPLTTFTAVLTERRQPVSVRELAAALVARHGGADAARALARALEDVLADPNADERSAGLAVACTRGLARTGDASRPILEALGSAANEPMSASVRAAAMETIGALCPTGAGDALKKGSNDPDGAVKRAARLALERCHR